MLVWVDLSSDSLDMETDTSSNCSWSSGMGGILCMLCYYNKL